MNAPNPMNAAAIEIPKEHMDQVLNSIICERLLGFERRMNDKMEYQWRGEKADGWTEWDEALVDFAGDLKEAQRILHRVCREARLGYNLIYDPRSDKHTIALLQVGEQGQPVPVVTVGGCSNLPQGISAAICGFCGFNLQEQHKLLYPGNYLLRS